MQSEEFDALLYLRKGEDVDGPIIEENDDRPQDIAELDSISSNQLDAFIEKEQLEAGTYTIEATFNEDEEHDEDEEQGGNFELSLYILYA